jgi:histidinol-phosphate aminotransferase
LNFEVPESFTNFLLAKNKDGKADEIYDKLVQRNIYVRYFDLPALSDKLRITVGTGEQNEKLVSALKEILSDKEA